MGGRELDSDSRFAPGYNRIGETDYVDTLSIRFAIFTASGSL